MPTEIERKYLVTGDSWRQAAGEGIALVQGYLGGNEKSSIRIRIHGENAYLNIKSRTTAILRSEFDYPIPVAEARELLHKLCDQPLIEKTRYPVRHQGHLWEIDVFAGQNEGLIVAEIELATPEEGFKLPAWAGQEVSHEPRYYNTCLVSHPYKDWRNG